MGGFGPRASCFLCISQLIEVTDPVPLVRLLNTWILEADCCITDAACRPSSSMLGLGFHSGSAGVIVAPVS